MSNSTAPMRALYFSDTYPPQVNGVSVVTELSVAGLRARGWQVGVVSPSYPAGTPDPFRTTNPIESPELAVGLPSTPMPGYRDLRLSAPLAGVVARAFDRLQPTIVHCATEFIIGRMGQREALRRGIPVVSSYHTDFSKYTVSYGVPWLRQFVAKSLTRFHRRSARVYTPSVPARDDLLRLGVHDVEVWGRGVDVTRFHPGHRDEALHNVYTPGGGLLLLHVGRLAAEKGIDVLVRAYLSAKERLAPEERIHLIIAGEGPAESSLRALGGPHVTFLGNLDRQWILPRLYASADAFLFASETETLGLVVLEAMASGLPVIATPEGGVADHLRHKVNGLAFPPGDVTGMANAIVELVRSADLHRGLAAGARATAQALGWESELDRLDASYREILIQHRLPLSA